MLSGRFVDNPTWLAPEVLENEYYSPAVDVYAAGVVFWELVTRESFFGEISFLSRVEEMIVAGLRPDIGECPAFYTQIIERCWSGNPNNRPSWSWIQDNLSKEKQPDDWSKWEQLEVEKQARLAENEIRLAEEKKRKAEEEERRRKEIQQKKEAEQNAWDAFLSDVEKKSEQNQILQVKQGHEREEKEDIEEEEPHNEEMFTLVPDKGFKAKPFVIEKLYKKTTKSPLTKTLKKPEDPLEKSKQKVQKRKSTGIVSPKSPDGSTTPRSRLTIPLQLDKLEDSITSNSPSPSPQTPKKISRPRGESSEVMKPSSASRVSARLEQSDTTSNRKHRSSLKVEEKITVKQRGLALELNLLSPESSKALRGSSPGRPLPPPRMTMGSVEEEDDMAMSSPRLQTERGRRKSPDAYRAMALTSRPNTGLLTPRNAYYKSWTSKENSSTYDKRRKSLDLTGIKK
uniref:Protein kinase domain-containing protein n=1 Tax=Arcella intermedia TaxID=1963864 RepID=A0A6B2L3A0_9EUKA